MPRTRSFTGKIYLAAAVAAAMAAEGAGSTYYVTNTADSGTGSLRAAILAANADSGADIISFNGLAIGVQTIAPTSPLPAITEAVTIDGATQFGFPGIPVIQIDGSLAGDDDSGLVINASGCVIRNLVICNWGDCGILITGSSNTVQMCTIGTNVNASAAAPNKYGIALRYDGQPVSGNLIGGSSQGNVISGNVSAGILLQNSQVSNTTIQGNKIGTDLVGGSRIDNNYGILVQSSSNNTIGGTTAGTRNLISGNATGIYLSGSSTGNGITGNYVGINVAGTAALSNTAVGIRVEAPGNAIGGTAADARNVVSGNGDYGILIKTATGNTVRNNYVGTNAAGTAALPNNVAGIRVEQVSGQVIGGPLTNEGNLISGNGNDGISLSQCPGAVVQGNRIGVTSSGGALGNTARGIIISDSANVLVGGTGTGEGNTIAYNGGVGVGPYSGSSSTRILGNTIFNSGSTLGIDINFDGAKPNDFPDEDGITNKPQIGAVSNSVPNQVTVQTTLHALPSTEYRIEYFSNPTAVSQGQVFLGSANLTTDETGVAEDSPTLSITGSLATGAYVTATATPTLTGGTSEFAIAAYVPVTLSAVTIE